MHQSTPFPRSRTTHRSSTTLPGSLGQKSRILAHMKRKLRTLFIYEAQKK